jgi:hypothetical protein
LGDSSADNAAQVSHHLEGCDACNQQLADIVAAFAVVAHAAPSRLPPLRVEQRLMRRISPRQMSDAQPSVAPPEASDDKPSARRLVTLAAAIAASVLVLVGLNSWRSRTTGESTPFEFAYDEALQRRINQANESDPLSVLPRLEFAFLREPVQTTPVHGYIAVDKIARQWHLHVSDLPPAPTDRKYQVWFVVDEQFVPAGDIEVDSAGNASRVFDLPADDSNPTGIAISDEPLAGSRQPTGANLFRANLP